MTDRPPPRRAEALLARALRDDPAGPSILGDLREDFAGLSRERGPGAACAWYWREALMLAAGRLVRGTHPKTGDSNMTDRATSALLQDAAYAVRSLRRNPGFFLFAAAVIALGVGAATSVFSVLRPLMIAPLPFEDPEALVWIEHAAEPGETSLSAVTSRSGNLRDFRALTRSFDGLTGYNAFFNQRAYTLTGSGEPEQLVGVGVAHDFLDVLGIRPALGRSFTEQEGGWGGPAAVILTHGFWTRRFAGAPDVVGTALILDGTPREVVGILPRSFDFSSVFVPGTPVDFLTTFAVGDETDRQGNTMAIVGRLSAGVTPAAAQRDLDAVVAGLQEREPDRWGLSARVSTLRDHVAGPYRTGLVLLAFAAGAVLLIVCVNVSNMLLARAPSRSREIAVRKALGASRGRLARQLLLETLGASLVGAVGGGVLAVFVTRWVAGTTAVKIPLLSEVGVDGGALLFAAGVAVLAGLAVGAIPALQVAEGGEAAVLRASGRGHSASRTAKRLRETLVVAEVALACVLLVVTGLMVRSFRAVMDVDLGFGVEDRVVWQLDPSPDFENPQELTAYFTALTDAVAARPEITSVGLADASPLGRNRTWGFRIVGQAEEDDLDDEIFPHIVDHGYLEAMGIPLVAGRGITRDDTREAAPVVLINEFGARRAFAGDPIGQKIRTGGRNVEWEIVGVVRDVRHLSPEIDSGIEVYFPYPQLWDFRTLDLVVRSELPAAGVASIVTDVVGTLDPAMPMRDYWTLEDAVGASVSARRFTVGLLGSFAAVALLLAGLGIYGVLAYTVSERRAEIGIRMALGASGAEVVRSIMARTLSLALFGIALGAAASATASGLLTSMLFEVKRGDPMTFVGMALVLLAVAATAGAVPAWRASRNDGVRALRTE